MSGALIHKQDVSHCNMIPILDTVYVFSETEDAY